MLLCCKNLHTILLTTVLCQLLQAQEYVVDIQQYDPTNGLLHRNVWCITEDSNHFIWLGLENGLQRFDGVNFKDYNPQNGFNHFSDISQIAIDDEGWIWAWNVKINEFVFIHTVTEETKSFSQKFGNVYFPIKSKKKGDIWKPIIMKNERNGTLYFINETPLQIISYQSKTGFVVHAPLEFSDMKKIDFIRFENGRFWALIRGENVRIVEFGINGEIISETPMPGKIWAGYIGSTDQNAYFIRPFEMSNFSLCRFNFDNRTMQMELFDHKFQPYATKNYLWKLKDATWSIEKDLKQILSIQSDIYKRSLTHIQNIFEDSDQRFWFFGPWGLSRVYIKQTHFKKYFSFSSAQKDLYLNAMRGMLVQNDTLYAAVEYHGIARVPLNNPERMEVLDGDFNSRLHFYGARCLTTDENGTIITAYGNSLKWIKGKNVLYEPIEMKDGYGNVIRGASQFEEIWSIFYDRGDIWIGASTSLWKRDKSGNYRQYILEKDTYNPIYFIRKEEGVIWVGTEKGLYKLPKGKSKFVKQTFLKGKNDIPVYTVYVHKNGYRYFGTPIGIVARDEEGIYSLMKDERSEISGNQVYGIFGDKQDNLWVSTNDGIKRLNLATGEIEIFHESDGISHNEFNRGSSYQDSRGNIYFGGLNGITAINPNLKLTEKEKDYKLHVTFFEKHSGKSDSLENLFTEFKKVGKIKYFPQDRFVRIRFAVPGIDNVADVLYAWKIKGLHNSWNYQKENLLQFTRLPYGKNTLQIKAQTGAGSWTEPVELEIQVVKPVVLRTWFLVMVATFILFIIITIFRARTYYLKKRQKELQREIETATAKIVKDKEIIEKQAEELRKMDEVKTRFFTNITHELRTPLSLIKGPLTSVLKMKQLDEKSNKFIQLAKNNTEILQKLISSLLDLSKLESESMKVNNTPVSLFEFTRRVVSNFESYVQQVGIEFIFDYKAAKSLHVKIDKEKLETILNNLISNAVKFTPEGGRITVTIHDMENQILIEVEDTGVGINAQDLPHIFDRFYQASNSDRAQTGGSGIGLTLSIELVRLMGGDITVESLPDKGSCFTVRLPRNEVLGSFEVADKDMERAINQESGSFNYKKGARVLIVEDNESFSNYLATILSEHYRTTCAFNGKKAIEILDSLDKSHLPDLILSDIMMPEMDGYQLLEHLKSHEAYWEIPVIMLTARVALQDKLKALRTGVDDYITKPFEEEELLIRIANLLKYASDRMVEQQKESQKLSMVDQAWFIELEKYVNENCTDEGFTVNDISDHFAMSASSLLRKVKLLTGLPPVDYLREHRLNMGKELLETRKMQTVAEIAFAVGFGNPKSFSRSFKMRFGKSPSSYFSNPEQ